MTSPIRHEKTEGYSTQDPGLVRELSIRKRIVRPKKLRRLDDESDTLSSPGAGPSSPRRYRSRSRSSERRKASHTPSQQRDKVAEGLASARSKSGSTRPPPCPHAPDRSLHPPLTSCRSVYNYTRLNHIEEGTYGVVFRAKCNATNEIYALKKLKLEEEKQGFPITSLREVMALMIGGRHENVVGIKEIVVGDTLNQ